MKVNNKLTTLFLWKIAGITMVNSVYSCSSPSELPIEEAVRKGGVLPFPLPPSAYTCGETTFHGLRYGDWKLLFRDQEAWFRAEEPHLSSPYIINLKLDPFERFTEARGYDEWAENRSWLFGPAGNMLLEFLATFKEFPPSQKSMSLDVSAVSDYLNSTSGN